jgi:hypothetical protein
MPQTTSSSAVKNYGPLLRIKKLRNKRNEEKMGAFQQHDIVDNYVDNHGSA